MFVNMCDEKDKKASIYLEMANADEGHNQG